MSAARTVPAAGGGRQGTGLELVLNACEGVLQLLVTDDENLLCAQEWHAVDRGAELLAPALEALCLALGVRLPDVRRIACVRGPGSFTGIRLVLATAAALRRVGQARLAGLDYMQALATSAVQRRGLLYGAPVWVLTHARRNLVHCQPFLSYGQQIPAQPLAAAELCPPVEALRRLRDSAGLPLPESVQGRRAWVCGSGLARNAGVFADVPGMRMIRIAPDAPVMALPELRQPSVEALRLLARHGDYFDRDVEPLYVRPCDAVENLPQIAPRLGLDVAGTLAALDRKLARAPGSEI